MIPTINHWFENVGLASLGLIISIPLIRFSIRIAPPLGWVDWPKARGLTERQIPIVGTAFLLLVSTSLGVFAPFFGTNPWLFTTAAVIGIMGHMDDRKSLPPLEKFLVQLLCATLVVLMDSDINQAILTPYGFTGAAAAIFFIVGLVNAVNFIDGIDGLAGVVIGAGALGFLLLNYKGGQLLTYSNTCSIIIGAIAVFLYFNVIKRRCFIGNSGSYFLSYVLAVMHLSVPLDLPGPLSRVCVSGLCFLIPISDSLMVVILRLTTLRSPFQADKGHLHHRLIQAGLPLRTILTCFGVIEMCGLSIALSFSGFSEIHPSVIPILVTVSFISISTLLVLLLDRTSKRRVESYFRRLDGGEPIYFLKYRVRNTDESQISSTKLRRLEARISTEIRVNDLCYCEGPDMIFVTLQTLPEPLKAIAARVSNIFQREGVHAIASIDQGEFIKVSYQSARRGAA